jgi:AcrR family transcriptional regulator
LASTVSLIRKEGLSSASPVKITQHAGMSWGAVQHHFGSKERLLRTIVLLSRDQFHEAALAQDYAGLDLADRIGLYVDIAWEHYQSDVFLASVEITFWHRNHGLAVAEDIVSDNGKTSSLTQAMVRQVFAGTQAHPDKSQEATEYMHCVLTGLAFQMILTGGASPPARHLSHCKDAMAKIILGAAE